MLYCLRDRRALSSLVRSVLRDGGGLVLPFLRDEADRRVLLWGACMAEMDHLRLEIEAVESARDRTRRTISDLLESFSAARAVRDDPRIPTVDRLVGKLVSEETKLRMTSVDLKELEILTDLIFPQKERATHAS